jgi:hypothetical protein
MSLDDAFKEIILYKANRMRSGLVPGSPYNIHIRRVLGQAGANVCGEQVENFVIGGVDAMIYDVASLVGFTANTPDFSDWASRDKRQETLTEIFPPQDRQQKPS